MAGFDPDVFGAPAGGSGYDADVFNAPGIKPLQMSSSPQSASAPAGNKFDLRNEEWAKIQNYSGRDAIGGAIRGAGSIGATLVRPLEEGPDNAKRRASMDEALTSLIGSDPKSMGYQTTKLLTEIAGTSGVGGAVANGLRAIPGAAHALPTLIPAIESAGFSANGAKGSYGMANRVAGGAINGGLTGGLVDPENARAGMLVGGALPPAIKAVGAAGEGMSNMMQQASNRLMQSAIKPTIAQLRSGDAAVATQTLLDKGINPNAAGVEKLRTMVDDTDNLLSRAIAGSPAQIDKQRVIQALNGTRQNFGSQVNPVADLDAINAAEQGFLNHPAYPGQTIPVQDAQALKQGTYRVLAKKYGEAGSASTEAQKALARGLKDEIASAVPEVGPYNAELSKLLKTLSVTERRALMEQNKNPLGLAALAGSPTGLLAFMADKSALTKSLAARSLYAASPAGRSLGLLNDPALLPYVRGGLLASEANP